MFQYKRIFNTIKKQVGIGNCSRCALDTTIDDDISYDSITISLYQKPHNKYQYIPTQSQHKSSIFKNFILQELKRYQLSCTLHSDFLLIVEQFKKRLEDRGYDLNLINTIILQLPTRTQQITELFHKSDSNKVHTKSLTQPIISLCLPKMIPNISWKEAFKLPINITEDAKYKSLYPSPDIRNHFRQTE